MAKWKDILKSNGFKVEKPKSFLDIKKQDSDENSKFMTATEMTNQTWFNSEEYIKQMEHIQKTVSLEDRKKMYPLIKWDDED